MSYSLSTKKQGTESRAIAKVNGGKLNGKIVYLVKGNEGKSLNKDVDYDELEGKMIKLKIKARERVKYFNEIAELLENKTNPKDVVGTDKNLIELYKLCCEEQDNEQVLKLEYGAKFEIMPSEDPKKSGRYYIAGMSESGKSYIAKDIIDNYHSLFPKRKIYVISRLKKDPTLDSSKAKLIRINPETFIDEPPTIEEFSDNKEGCLIVFDDFDSFKGKIGAIIQAFIDDVLMCGRHENISTVLCTHYLTNYKQSAIKLAESQYYVIFPNGATSKKLSYLLENYGGIDDKNVKMIKRLGRWALVSRCFPQYIVSESEVRILNKED